MELLAPAGHWDAMVAAVQCGADAVYMGYGDYNARRGARNFSQEEFLAAVSYCHLRGVKVYLTLNTLLGDRELEGALALLRQASQAGVDRVIVQDWGIAALCREALPDLPLHGSTQMTVHNAAGVRELERLGFACTVLSRELDRAEIAAACRAKTGKVEVFAHGALCMCYSGQCAMSALIGGRSGNRGRCAQPCRLPYQLEGGGSSHPLSLKDACLAGHLQQLEALGVDSLKLEGRMKRPEYVAVVTGIYARLLREKRAPTPAELRTLEAAFSRSGFTDGYFRGKTGPEMFGSRPENTPEPTALFAGARAAYSRENLRLVPVELAARFRPGAPAELTAADGDGHAVTVTGAVPETARSRALTAQEAEQRLCKTGGTAFVCRTVRAEVAEGLAMSAAALNALRRDALDRLAQLRTAPPERRSLPIAPLDPLPNPAKPPEITVSVLHPRQLSRALLALEPAVVSVPVHLIGGPLPDHAPSTRFSAELPRIWRDSDEDFLRRQLERARDLGYTAVQIHNIGQLPMARESGLTMRGDYGLNLFNSRAVEFWRGEGLESATLSFELRHAQLRDIRKSIPCEAIVYGRLPLMITENCLVRNRFGCSARDLTGPCTSCPTLTDRRGERFPVCPAFGCRSEIENSKILFLADKPEYKQLGLAYARLRFTTESPQACAAAAARYAGQGNGQPDSLTRGLFYRGVE